MEAVEGGWDPVCPVCGERWSDVPEEVREKYEFRTDFMDRHRAKHGGDIPAGWFVEEKTEDENDTMVRNP